MRDRLDSSAPKPTPSNNKKKSTLFRVTTAHASFDPLRPFEVTGQESSIGTGFAARARGKIIVVTNHHVVENATRVTATRGGDVGGEDGDEDGGGGGGIVLVLDVVGISALFDVAVLALSSRSHEESCQSESSAWNFFDFDSDDALRASDRLRTGSLIVASGYAGGEFSVSVTKGSVSGHKDWPHDRVQTDTAVNAGMSGGPVQEGDEEGPLVGIVTSGEDHMQATNYFVRGRDLVRTVRTLVDRAGALPSSTGPSPPLPVYDQGGHVNFVVRAVDAKATGFDDVRGALVVGVAEEEEKGGEGGRGGGTALRKGDVIVEVETHPLDSKMRVSAPEVWVGDRVDFRCLFDEAVARAVYPSPPALSVVVVDSSSGARRNVSLELGPPRTHATLRSPDVFPVRYVLCGGVLFQTWNRGFGSYDLRLARRGKIEPSQVTRSFPIVTFRTSDSPFVANGFYDLVGERLVACVVSDARGRSSRGGEDAAATTTRTIRKCESLEDFEDVVREASAEGSSLVVTRLDFESGVRVGASPRALVEYASSLRERNVHDVLGDGVWIRSGTTTSTL